MLHVGVHRYVFTVWSFALKVPRIAICEFLKLVIEDIKNRKRYWCSWHWFVEVVFDGLKENFREASCYLNTKHSLLTRLYVPLLLINVYHREKGVGSFSFGGEELFDEVCKAGDREFVEALRPCSHTFDHPDNFAYSEGRVRVLDYGERGFENLLNKYGDKVERILLSKVKQSA
jgi:hypothetical protein